MIDILVVHAKTQMTLTLKELHPHAIFWHFPSEPSSRSAESTHWDVALLQAAQSLAGARHIAALIGFQSTRESREIVATPFEPDSIISMSKWKDEEKVDEDPHCCLVASPNWNVAPRDEAEVWYQIPLRSSLVLLLLRYSKSIRLQRPTALGSIEASIHPTETLAVECISKCLPTLRNVDQGWAAMQTAYRLKRYRLEIEMRIIPEKFTSFRECGSRRKDKINLSSGPRGIVYTRRRAYVPTSITICV